MNVSKPERSATSTSQSMSIVSRSTTARRRASVTVTPSTRDLDNLAVLRVGDLARLGEEGAEVGREGILALAVADDERRLAADTDDQVGVVVVHDDDGEVPLEAAP